MAALQHVAEIGAVLFMFTVGLAMRPRKVWAMRRLLLGMGSAQMLVTAAILAAYFVLVVFRDIPEVALIESAFGLRPGDLRLREIARNARLIAGLDFFTPPAASVAQLR